MAKKSTQSKKPAPQPKSAPKRPESAAGHRDEMDLEAIERLMHLMAQNGVLELEVLNGPDRKVRLSRKAPDAGNTMIMSAPMGHHASGPITHAAAHQAAAAAAAAKDAGGVPPGCTEFCSPMVGTFYRAPNPESPPFIVPGDKVNPESVLCIIEAMKVMNEIKAEISGEVIDVLVENGEAVEYGQPLFLIKKPG